MSRRRSRFAYALLAAGALAGLLVWSRRDEPRAAAPAAAAAPEATVAHGAAAPAPSSTEGVPTPVSASPSPALDEAAGERRETFEARTLLLTDPARAMAMAQEAERRYGETPLSPYRKATVVRALVQMERIGAARAEAGDFLSRYPKDEEAEDLAALTGAHAIPHRDG